MLAFAAVAIAFVASTAMAEYWQLEIRREAADITGNSSPSIEHLAELRGELRRFTLLEDDEVDRGMEGLPLEARVGRRTARDRMDRAWALYRTLPMFARERELVPKAERARAELDAAVRRVEGAMDGGRWSAARESLDHAMKPAADRLDDVLLQILDINADAGARLARHIEALGRRSIVMAAALDGVSVLLTILAALLAVRTVRRYTSLLERRAEELELFAGRVAHDVLGPLGAAGLALDVADRDAAPGSRAKRMIASGRAGLKRARTIADGLLEFARAGARATPGERANVCEVVRAVIDEGAPAADQSRISVTVELADGLAVACNPGILTSVVSNLVRNAIKYIGEGPGKRVVVRARAAGDGCVRIEVEDNGPGLPAELGSAVFEPYVRGSGSQAYKPGIGLGLATVKKIAEAHGGRVDVRSVPGQGCRFGVELPVAPPAERTAQPAAAQLRPAPEERRPPPLS
jgi:signal transduction histidine kinase